MNDSCKCNLEKEQILMEFGNDSLMKNCNQCPLLTYENGLMTCKKINEGEE